MAIDKVAGKSFSPGSGDSFKGFGSSASGFLSTSAKIAASPNPEATNINFAKKIDLAANKVVDMYVDVAKKQKTLADETAVMGIVNEYATEAREELDGLYKLRGSAAVDYAAKSGRDKHYEDLLRRIDTSEMSESAKINAKKQVFSRHLSFKANHSAFTSGQFHAATENLAKTNLDSFSETFARAGDFPGFVKFNKEAMGLFSKETYDTLGKEKVDGLIESAFDKSFSQYKSNLFQQVVTADSEQAALAAADTMRRLAEDKTSHVNPGEANAEAGRYVAMAKSFRKEAKSRFVKTIQNNISYLKEDFKAQSSAHARVTMMDSFVGSTPFGSLRGDVSDSKIALERTANALALNLKKLNELDKLTPQQLSDYREMETELMFYNFMQSDAVQSAIDSSRSGNPKNVALSIRGNMDIAMREMGYDPKDAVARSKFESFVNRYDDQADAITNNPYEYAYEVTSRLGVEKGQQFYTEVNRWVRAFGGEPKGLMPFEEQSIIRGLKSDNKDDRNAALDIIVSKKNEAPLIVKDLVGFTPTASQAQIIMGNRGSLDAVMQVKVGGKEREDVLNEDQMETYRTFSENLFNLKPGEKRRLFGPKYDQDSIDTTALALAGSSKKEWGEWSLFGKRDYGMHEGGRVNVTSHLINEFASENAVELSMTKDESQQLQGYMVVYETGAGQAAMLRKAGFPTTPDDTLKWMNNLLESDAKRLNQVLGMAGLVLYADAEEPYMLDTSDGNNRISLADGFKKLETVGNKVYAAIDDLIAEDQLVLTNNPDGGFGILVRETGEYLPTGKMTVDDINSMTADAMELLKNEGSVWPSAFATIDAFSDPIGTAKKEWDAIQETFDSIFGE